MSEIFEPNPLNPETPPEKPIQQLAEEIYNKRSTNGPVFIMDVPEGKREAVLAAVSALCKGGEVEESMPPIIFVDDKDDIPLLASHLPPDNGANTMREAMKALKGIQKTQEGGDK